jgi:hypothetical protein
MVIDLRPDTVSRILGFGRRRLLRLKAACGHRERSRDQALSCVHGKKPDVDK